MIQGRKLFLFLFSAVVLAACSSNGGENVVDNNGADKKIEVVATVGMLGDMVKNIGGEHVSVKTLMGASVDPHAYQPTAGDLTAMEKADVVFYVGLHLEGKMVEIFESLSASGKAFSNGESLDTARLIVADENIYDPHIWFDVELWADSMVGVRDKLIEVDPKNADSYRENYEKYLSELQELHNWVSVEISAIPEEKRVLVTAHDAFSYLGRAYDLEVRAIQGINTVSEYGVQDLEQLVNFIAERGISLVFVESSVSQRSINALIEGVKGRGGEVAVGGELFSDAMGPANTIEGTYVGMVKHNVTEISKLGL